MKILHLISSAGNYGAEQVVVNLTKQLQRLECEIVVGVFENSHKRNVEIAVCAEREGLTVQLFRCSGKVDWQTVRLLREFVWRFRPDIVHTHGYKADIYSYLAIRKLGFPLVATRHGEAPASKRMRVYGILDSFALKHFDRAVGVSSAVAQNLKRILGARASRVVTITNGIDCARFKDAYPTLSRGIPPHKHVVGMVGRLSPEKAPENLLFAVQKVLIKVPDTLFVVVGDGPMRGQLESIARELGIADSVHFTGYRDDMAGVYASMDVMVLPSLQEGLPNAVLEAMASSVPVIATAVGGLPSLITDGETGLLVNPGDVESLTGRIIELLQDSVLRRKLGAAAQKCVQLRYSSEQMAVAYMRVYQRTLALRSGLRVPAASEVAQL